MSNSNHIVTSDPSEGFICVAAGVGRNQCHYPCIARSLLGCDRLLLPPCYMSQGVISKGLLAMKSLQEYPDSWMFAAEQGVKGVMECLESVGGPSRTREVTPVDVPHGKREDRCSPPP